MSRVLSCLLFVLLAACASGPDRGAEVAASGAAPETRAWRGLSVPARLSQVSLRVGPVGEATCRGAAPHADIRGSEDARNCAFVIALDPDRNLPANALQGVLPDGRPLVGFTHAMVARAANEHELALVMGHEMAHHIADHAPREALRIAESRAGADRAIAADADPTERLSPRRAEDRAFLRGIELEADRLGAQIAAAAGYDVAQGSKIIRRLHGPAGAWDPLDYYPTAQARVAAVLNAMHGPAGGPSAHRTEGASASRLEP